MNPAKPQPHESDSRTIRVFVSSTFLDMQAERDYLVTVTFPALRRLCESRGVVWGEIDLRWGVTDEEAAEGKVLPICLEEIKRCRPYFIGLLGERYGWVPDSISEELIKQESWLEEQLKGRKSVTELEILHGVLRNPAMAGHSFFYFRDPEYIDSVPESKRKDFICESPNDKDKLDSLKEQIKRSGFPFVDGFKNPKELGKRIEDDLTAVIDILYPEGSQPDPLTRERIEHAAYARSRERVYIGRDEDFNALNTHAESQSEAPLVLVGESGVGKSALLANWAKKYGESHSETFVFTHFIGATASSANLDSMLRRIVGELKARFDIQQEVPESADALRSAFPNWLYMASAKGKCVVILDALNQLEDSGGALDLIWLPPVTPPNVRLIISTLPSRALDEIEKRRWPRYEVRQLDEPDRLILIGKFLKEYTKSLSPEMSSEIARAQQTGNPLYLRVLLDELRVFGDHRKLKERIEHYLQAQNPYELYGKVIARWEKTYEQGSDIVGDTLSLIWASRRGLSEAEILDALGSDGKPMPRAEWSPLFIAMSDALVDRQGLLTFAHDYLRTAARDQFIPTEQHQQKAHHRLADYFKRGRINPRSVDELPWQLAEACDWQQLYRLFAHRTFFTTAWNRSQFEVRTYWAQIEANSPLRLTEAYSAQIKHPETEADKDYLWKLGSFLLYTGHLDESLHLRAGLVEHYKAADDAQSLQGSLGNQAAILLTRGDQQAAMALFKEQEHICRELGNLSSLQGSFGSQAAILIDMGDLDRAMTLSKEQEHICREQGLMEGLSYTLTNQSVILQLRGDLDGSMMLMKESEQIFRQLGNLDGLSTCLGNQAKLFQTRRELSVTMALYSEQEKICRQLGTKASLANSLYNQANVLSTNQGNDDQARTKCVEAHKLFSELGMEYEVTQAQALQYKLTIGTGNQVKVLSFGVGVLAPTLLAAFGIALGLWKHWLWFIGGPIAVISVAYIALIITCSLSLRARSALDSRLKQIMADLSKE